MNKRMPEPFGQIVFSTDGMSSQDAFARWRDMFYESAAPCRIEQMGSGNFAAHGRVQNIGKLALFTSTCRQEFTSQGIRHRSEIARSREDSLMLFLRNGNAHGNIKYGKREAVKLCSGMWMMMHPQDICESTARPGLVEYHALTIPADACLSLPPVSGDAFGRAMTSDNLVNRLVANYIQTLASGIPITDTATGEALARNLMELITFALHAAPETGETCSNGLASGLLLAITQYLDAHYMEAGLSPAQVAAQFGITPRYVHRLFERTGTTFTEHLFQQRLRHAHRVLSDPLNRHRSITEIAYDCGFQNLTHFGRRYRERYGETPSDTRAGR